MQKNRLHIKVVLFLAAALFLISTLALAGGGINWKVTVKNDTNYKCKVNVSKDKLTIVEWMGWRTLEPGQQTTFETGSLCPCGIKGEVYDANSKTWKKTRTVNIGLANEIAENGEFCSAACWDSSWKLCRKAGTDADSLRDKDFSWCKN
jgi:hypothetical protein